MAPRWPRTEGDGYSKKGRRKEGHIDDALRVDAVREGRAHGEGGAVEAVTEVGRDESRNVRVVGVRRSERGVVRA